jgi:hypothetical protein
MNAVEAFERLLAGLAKSGFSVERSLFGNRFDLSVRDPEGERDFQLELKLVRLRPGGHHPVEFSWRARVPRRGSGSAVRPLTIGYRDADDPFVGWPLHDGIGAPGGVDLWVPLRTLRNARESGFAEPHGRSHAFAFRPDQVGQYLRLHGDLQLIASDARVDFEALDSQASAVSALRTVTFELGDFVGAQRLQRSLPRPSVESGFVSPVAPRSPLDQWSHVEPDSKYQYWLSIGDEPGAWMYEPPSPLPEELPDGARIVVRLFAFEDELRLTGPLRGVLELQADGSVTVVEPAAPVRDPLGDSRLFFDVQTPSISGRHRLRCNLYYGSTLVQSRLVSAQVGEMDEDDGPALRTEVDYSLARLFDADTLSRIPRNDLSLMINGGVSSMSGVPAHQFRVYADDADSPLEASANFGEAQIGAAIELTRGALRSASWATEAEWDGKSRYLYETAPAHLGRLTTDLVRMARRGRELYDAVTSPIPTAEDLRDRFRSLTARPSRIEVTAPTEGTYLPAGLFYDHKIETAPGEGEQSNYRLCPDFVNSIEGSEPLEQCGCFDSCPGADDRFLVCPSGFWGFRHEIGWPVPGKTPISEIGLDGSPRLAIGVSTDPAFKLRDAHIEKVSGLGKGRVGKSRDEFAEIAKSLNPHLVYFYCHGGVKASSRASYIVLGELGSAGIDTAYLRDEDIVWGTPPPRPLVFINGCHTSALSPSTVASLVSGFVGESGAAGVVGTEVTIFEPLACDFAEAVLESFLDASMSIGAAIRHARLKLLRDRNPLGLVYVPYIAAATRLVKTPTR